MRVIDVRIDSDGIVDWLWTEEMLYNTKQCREWDVWANCIGMEKKVDNPKILTWHLKFFFLIHNYRTHLTGI